MIFNTLVDKHGQRSKDEEALKKMKALEKEQKLHTFKIDRNTIVNCKNKENIQRYMKQ